MKKLIFNVEGMKCGMCETHVNDVVRKVGGVSKVKSSHAKGKTEVVAEDGVNAEDISSAIAAQGYTVSGYTEEEYKKHGLFG